MGTQKIGVGLIDSGTEVSSGFAVLTFKGMCAYAFSKCGDTGEGTDFVLTPCS